ncbi:hypothetical protein FOZ62_025915 [Perkinsus olseni]|uniref:Uncharacterized protein n=1 Tax=Perkinsus olseni TaxID=32597 RepID=A0A7J6TBH5_PEROL|nr:hypothetical protein FOZ62_025915 [Perkinsus olseni]
MSVSVDSAGSVKLEEVTGIHVNQSPCKRCQDLESRLNQELLKRDVARSCISHYRQAIVELQNKLKFMTTKHDSVVARLSQLRGTSEKQETSEQSPPKFSHDKSVTVEAGAASFGEFSPECPDAHRDQLRSEDRDGKSSVAATAAIAVTQTSPWGYPKGVQTERSVTALAQGLAYEVAAEVGEFLADKEGQSGIEIHREAAPSEPGRRFCTACGRRATVGIPKSSQTDIAADDPEDGVLWPKLSAYLYKGPTKHLAAHASTQTEYTAAGAFHDLVHDVGQMMIQNRAEESETSGEEYVSNRRRHHSVSSYAEKEDRGELPRPRGLSSSERHEDGGEPDDDWEISDDEVDDAEDVNAPKKSFNGAQKGAGARTEPARSLSSSGRNWSRRWLGSLTSGLSVPSLGRGQNQSG